MVLLKSCYRNLAILPLAASKTTPQGRPEDLRWGGVPENYWGRKQARKARKRSRPFLSNSE